MKRTSSFKGFLTGLVILLTLSLSSFAGTSPPFKDNLSKSQISVLSVNDVVSQVATDLSVNIAPNLVFKLNLVQASNAITALPAKSIDVLLPSIAPINMYRQDKAITIYTINTTTYIYEQARNRTEASLREHPRICGKADLNS